MKRTTLINRLERLNYNKNKASYKLVTDFLGIGKHTYHVFSNVIRPCWTSGSGRYCTNQDHTNETLMLLDTLKIKYSYGNDAPKGGLTGNYIKIETKITEQP